MTITIYHNPKCSTARQVLQALQEAGWQPTVVDYLKSPPSVATLRALAQKMPRPHDLLRTKEPLYKTLSLSPEPSVDEVANLLHEHPVLLNRPICETPTFVMAVRPSAAVSTFLERLQK